MVQRVVISRDVGTFGLSRAALHRLRELGNETTLDETDFGERWPSGQLRLMDQTAVFCRHIPRDDPDLLTVIDELGVFKCAGYGASLSIVEVRDGLPWQLFDCGGYEGIQAYAHED